MTLQPVSPPVPLHQQPLLDGSWERSGRSPASAAILALIGIGAIYFNVQSIFAALVVIIASAFRHEPVVTGSLLDRAADQIKYLADPLRFVVTFTEYVFMLLPALWIVRRWHSSTPRSYIRLERTSVAVILLAVLTTLALIPASNYISDEFIRQLRVPKRLIEINAEIFTARSPGELTWLVFVVCVTPALCEETFFRGLVQRTFERTMGWKSVVLVGVIFGLFHFNPLGLVTLAVLGMLFGYFYYRSRSLLPSMIAHFTNNLIAILSLYRTPSGGPTVALEQVPLWLVGITLPIGIALMFAFDKITSRPVARNEGVT